MVTDSPLHHDIWPRVAVIAGSGLAAAIPEDCIVDRRSMSEIPGLPPIHVAGHQSDLVIVDIEGRHAVIALGRTHLYEGYSPAAITAMVQTMAGKGCTHLLLTNAAGGLHPTLRVGDVVVVQDVMNATGRELPANDVHRTTEIIDQRWSSAILKQGTADGVLLRSGIYVSVLGPSYETRAEVRMYRRMGATVIGMSTVLEAECAHRNHMHVGILSLVTNVLSDTHIHHLDHLHVVEAGKQGAQRIWATIKAAIFTA